MTATAKKKVGIIGYGTMGKWHQEKLTDLGFVDVVAAYDVDPLKYEAPEAAILRKCSDLGELLALPLDFVVIATPNNFHKKLSIKALEAGKHVLCEKPVALNASELAEMLAVSRRCGKVFSVHQNRRWDKDFRVIKKVYDEHILGKPFFIESRMQGANGIPKDWRTKKASGGGMLLDWGIHLIDQILWMIDSPIVEAYPQMLKINSDECDDMVKIVMRFENGVNALVEVNTFCLIPEWRWHYCGDKGSLYINNFVQVQGIMRRVKAPDSVQAAAHSAGSGPTRTFAPRSPDSYDELPLPQDVDSDHLGLYRNFIAACEGKEELIIKPEQSTRVMRFVDAMFECARNGVAFKGSL